MAMISRATFLKSIGLTLVGSRFARARPGAFSNLSTVANGEFRVRSQDDFVRAMGELSRVRLEPTGDADILVRYAPFKIIIDGNVKFDRMMQVPNDVYGLEIEGRLGSVVAVSGTWLKVSGYSVSISNITFEPVTPFTEPLLVPSSDFPPQLIMRNVQFFAGIDTAVSGEWKGVQVQGCRLNGSTIRGGIFNASIMGNINTNLSPSSGGRIAVVGNSGITVDLSLALLKTNIVSGNCDSAVTGGANTTVTGNS